MSDSHTDDWTSCPAGEVGGLSSRLRARSQSRFVWTAVTAVVLIGIGVGVVLSVQHDGRDADWISHEDVKANAEKYVRGEVDADLKRRIDKHLAHCGSCREYVSRKREQMRKGKTGRDRGGTVVAIAGWRRGLPR